MSSLRSLIFATCCLAFFGLQTCITIENKKVMCYFGSWSVYRHGNGHFDVEDIDPFICTHLMFGFAGLDQQTYKIKALDPYNELYDNWGKGAFQRFTGLKKINPNVVTILAIGGWNEGSTAYSEMASTSERRKIFIDSCIDMILEHNFDGLDLDWEYPGGREDSPGLPDDKTKFALLLQEMRAEFDKHGLLMTAAVSAGWKYIDNGYDVPVMAETLDIIALMTYDYHGWWKDHAFTGHNSPLYPLPEEADPLHPGHNCSTDWSVNYWLSLGAKKSQLLVGMGAYGRGFRLSDSSQNGFYAPASAGIVAGPYTGSSGFWGYNEYCERMQSEGTLWTKVRDDRAVAPYIYNNEYWFGFDDEYSIRVKSQYILDMGLGGAMVWSLDTDDFLGLCGGQKFALIKTIDEVLNGGIQTAPPGYTTPNPSQTTNQPSSSPGSTLVPTEECDGTPGYKPVEGDCRGFYQCFVGSDGEWDIIYHSCPETQIFDPESQKCVNPNDHPDLCSDHTISTPTTTPDPNQKHCSQGSGFYTPTPCSNSFWRCDCDGSDTTNCRIYDQNCPPELYFSKAITACDFPENIEGCQEKRTSKIRKLLLHDDDFICPSEGLFPKGVCDEQFYQCAQEFDELVPYLKNCPSPLVFDAVIQVCNYRENVTECFLPPSEVCKVVGLNPDPENACSSNYFDCKVGNGKWIIEEHECKDGNIFDPDLLMCAPESSVAACNENTSTTAHDTTTTTVTSTTTTVTTTSGEDTICKKEGLNPDPSDPRECDLYYHCRKVDNGWEITECHCTDGLVFDPEIQVCTWATSDDCVLRFIGKDNVDTLADNVCNAGKMIVV